MISPQATESQLEWGQVKLYEAWNKNGSGEKIKTKIKRKVQGKEDSPHL